MVKMTSNIISIIIIIFLCEADFLLIFQQLLNGIDVLDENECV
jgi:hypothetical protein